jgi:hypothetical protein
LIFRFFISRTATTKNKTPPLRVAAERGSW